ncbi:MAG: hypothetical protein LQ338_005727 [Usnochroma carphineum]|nr:MAG: hypothetical protein LQ338_005727 [Usnochroma carphineum]
MSNPPRIAIIGAGPGGLTLARLLHVKQIPFSLYEREPHRNSRPQGGCLDLHPETGQLALREAGLFEEFTKIARSEGEDMVIADKNGERYFNQVSSEDGDRPEVDRVQLRGMLLDSLPPKAVQWGRSVRSVARLSDGKMEIQLQEPSGCRSERFDLVVGADGAWSRVRPLLTETNPHYSTISGLDLTIRDVDSNHPEVGKLVGRGMYAGLSGSKGLVAQRNGDNSIRVYAMLRRPESWLKDCGVDFANEKMTKDFLSKEFDDFAPPLKDLFLKADPDVVARALYMFPIDHTWNHVQGATLLGDAAHLMTPFAGEGVNLAMIDALDISNAVAAAATSDDLDEAIRVYEQEMFERSHRSMKETWHNLELMFMEDAPKSYVKEFEEMMAQFHGPSGEEHRP